MADADFTILDPRFARVVNTDAQVERLFAGCRWAEGPAWFPAHRTLVWSDVQNDRMLRWDEATGGVGAFRQPCGHANGNTVDRQGRLLTCEHSGRRVSRTEHDGSLTTIASHWEGRRLNSPNDLVVAADGAVWFTDPAYGIDSDYEGRRAVSEIDGCHVYRVDPVTSECRVAADDFVRPNGLAFSPDGRRLYVVDTGATHMPDGPRHIRAFEVDGAGLRGGQVFATCTAGLFDGFRLDDAGRLWAGAADGVHCIDPDGTLLGKVLVPERVANVCFGGARLNRLFMAATTSLYAVMLPVNGAPPQ